VAEMASPIAVSISSLRYGKFHFSGASITPSSDRKSDATTFLMTSFPAWLRSSDLLPAATAKLIARMGAIPQEQQLLDAARGGDQDAFRRLVEPHRTALLAHCYRMLGSLHDAEDALQDTLLRAWRGLSGFEQRRPLRPWLYRIATNASLDVIGKRPKRVLPIDHAAAADADAGPGKPIVERIWLEPFPDEQLGVEDGYAAPEARYEQRESVELAFVAALQHLPARQRAVLLLREVLGFSAREVAEYLETTTAAVNSALQRARRAVEERLPAHSQQATLRSLGDERLRAVVQRYIEAWESRNGEALVNLLVEEARFAMPPFPNWFDGRDAVIAFITSTGRPRLRSVETRASGQPAVGWYIWNPGRELYLPAALEVLTLEEARVKEIVAFASPALYPRFGLPTELPVGG
jgi:RNA polymerase sigma-70 factor, ECF subfamily